MSIATSFEQESEEYKAFVEKFKPKKTTDDCYTPPVVYEAVKNWAVQEYGLEGRKIERPFYPGGDYEHYNYGENSVVIDNPPFSILTKIVNFYMSKSIDFFLFAPTMTLANCVAKNDASIVLCGAYVIYENGAVVRTSFVTNLEESKIYVAPALTRIMKKADKKSKRKKQLAKYSYPAEIATSSRLNELANKSIEFRISKKDCVFVSAMDEQRKAGKKLFGGGFLLSEKAAAEKAAAEKAAAEKAATIVWQLSEREKEIIRRLGE